jgi:hypothetical protein
LAILSDESAFEETFCKACPKFIIPGAPDYDGELVNTNQEPLQFQLKNFTTEVKRQLVLPTIRSYLKLYTTIPISKLANFLEVDEEVLRYVVLRESAPETRICCVITRLIASLAFAVAVPTCSCSSTRLARWFGMADQLLMAALWPSQISSSISMVYVIDCLMGHGFLLCLSWANWFVCHPLISRCSPLRCLCLQQDMIHIADTKVTKTYGDYFVNYINKFENVIHSLDEVGKDAGSNSESSSSNSGNTGGGNRNTGSGNNSKRRHNRN